LAHEVWNAAQLTTFEHCAPMAHRLHCLQSYRVQSPAQHQILIDVLLALALVLGVSSSSAEACNEDGGTCDAGIDTDNVCILQWEFKNKTIVSKRIQSKPSHKNESQSIMPWHPWNTTLDEKDRHRLQALDEEDEDKTQVVLKPQRWAASDEPVANDEGWSTIGSVNTILDIRTLSWVIIVPLLTIAIVGAAHAILSDSADDPATSYTRLIGSHGLALFGGKLWEFATPVLLASVWQDTLLPAAIFTFTLYLMKFLFLPFLGRCVDTTDRLTLLTVTTIGENACLSISAFLLALLAWRVEESKTTFGGDVVDVILFVVLVSSGVVGDLFMAMSSFGAERDWVSVLSEGDVDRLAKLNSRMLRMKLFCKFVAPLAWAIIAELPSTPSWQIRVGAGVVAGWCMLSTTPILFAWRSVYNQHPLLRTVKGKKDNHPLQTLVQGISCYLSHRVFLAAFSFSCLFFTVLSDHHPLTSAYFKTLNCSITALSIMRACAALMGMVGTYLFEILAKSLGTEGTAVLSAWLFAFTVSAVPGLMIVTGGALDQAHITVVFCLIVVSRCWLWSFDAANVQLLQLYTRDGQLGEISGVQSANCVLMEFFMSVLTLIYNANYTVCFFASSAGCILCALTITVWAQTQRDYEPVENAVKAEANQ